MNKIEYKENSYTFLIITLGLLSAFGPFVTDMYLPCMPTMTSFFSTNSTFIQLTLTASMIGLSLGQLLVGPLSDKLGRRTPLIWSMYIFMISTLVCIFAPNVYIFIVFRLIQGMAGAGGVVISRSVATDTYQDKELGKILAIIGAINGIAPVISPVIGGLMMDYTGWRGIFTVLLGIGVLITLLSYKIKESLPQNRRIESSVLSSFKGFGVVLRNKAYLIYTLQLALIQGVLFANIASSPFIIQEHYGYSPLIFSICFAVNSIFIAIGAAISVKFPRPQTATLFSSILTLSLATTQCVAMFAEASFFIYEGLLILIMFALGISFPSSTTLAMSSARENAGAGSALLGASCFAIGGLVSPLVSIGEITTTTGVIFVIFAALSLICALAIHRSDKKSSELQNAQS